jgi:hypothetical protein
MKNKEQKQASNFQAKHKARKQIKWDLAEIEDGPKYWNEFYNPFNEFLMLLSKRELAFILDKAVSDPNAIDKMCKDYKTKNHIGSWINVKLQFKNNSHPEQKSWFRTLSTKCYLICENGQGIKI